MGDSGCGSRAKSASTNPLATDEVLGAWKFMVSLLYLSFSALLETPHLIQTSLPPTSLLK